MGVRSRVSEFGWLVCLALVLGLPAGVVWAHGGGTPRLTNADAGPYWVSVWTQPDPLRVGQAHITVAVSQPGESQGGRREAGSPVLDATVQVRLQPLDRAGEALAVAATHAGAANKLFYEGDVELPETGQWQVSIAVEGPDGPGSASFEAQVSSPTAFNWTWIGGLGLLALTGLWTVRRFWDRRSRE